MSSAATTREPHTAGPSRTGGSARPHRRRGRAILSIAAAAMLASLPAVAGSAADAQTGDTSDADTAADGVVASPPPPAPTPARPGEATCPRPPTGDEGTDGAAEGGGLNDWCIPADEWIEELTCGPAEAHEGRTLRYNAGGPDLGRLLRYDLCGYEEQPDDCPPTAQRTSDGAGADEDPPAGTTEAALGDTAEAALGDATEAALGDAVEAAIDELAPDGGEEASPPPKPAVCGEPWPSGTWSESSQVDPISGSPSATGRISGAWLGTRDHRAAATPTLTVRCEAGRLSVALRTGGGTFGGYGRGVPVDYRVAEVIVSEAWQEIDATDSLRTGVSPPPWLLDRFVALLAENPQGEFAIRVFRHDGTPVGVAAFDLAGIEQATGPARRTCWN